MRITLFQGILSALFVLAAAIGVFVFATHTGKSNGGAATVGTVVIWGTLPRTDFQNALTDIMKGDQTLKGVSYVQKNPDTISSDLASAIAIGGAPDLILASQEGLSSLSKLIVPLPSSTLPPATFNAAFIGEGRLFATPDGSGYYGVPFLVDPLVLFSNHAILASSGIAKPPATWEALTGLVPNVATLTPNRQITRGLIALGAYDNIRNARGILSAIFLQTGVPLSYYRTGVLVADLNGSATGGQLPGPAALNFYTQFADPSKVSYTWNASLPDSRQMFLAGDLALFIGYVSEARFLRVANPNLDFNVSPLPQPATATLKSTYGLVYAFMIPRGAKNASGAYQAAVMLVDPAAQALAAPALGMAPAALDALGTAPADSIAAVAYTGALYAGGWLSPAPADTDAVFSSMITGVISGRLTSDRALTSSEISLSSLLQK